MRPHGREGEPVTAAGYRSPVPPPRQLPRTIVDSPRDAGGQWMVVVDDGDALEVTVGRTALRLGGVHRAPRRSWRVVWMAGQVEVLGTFPVRELLTHRIGQVTGALGDVAPADLAEVRQSAARLTGMDRETVEAILWSAAFPLLGPVLDRGTVLPSVPEALDPLLRARSVRAGVRRLFGRTTRPLVRATAERLVPAGGGPPVFAPLVLAAMGAGACGPERLTEIVATEPAHPGADRFGTADVDRARHVLDRSPARAVTALLRGALVEPAGAERLAEHLAQWSPPRPAAPPRPPAPPRPTAPPRRPAPPPRPPAALIEHPAAWQAAAGRSVAGHTIVLPGTTDDLRRWGRLLDNCLGSYEEAAATGRSRLLGLERDRRLCFAVEITPGGTIRQIEGRGNSQAPAELGRRIARGLVELGLARADGRNGRSLLAPR